MGAGQLARVGIGAKDVAGAVVGPVDPGDLTWRRIPDQLQQGDPTVFWPLRCSRTDEDQDAAEKALQP